MNPLTASSIIEFVLQQTSVDDHLVSLVLSSLPLPLADDPNLCKSILLRHLRSASPDRVLHSLEIIHEFDRLSLRKGSRVLPSMRAAYCSAAVHSTVRHSVGGFKEAVRKIWSRGVADLKPSEENGFVSRKTVWWMKRMEQAVANDQVRREVMEGDTEEEFTRHLRRYLKEAGEEMRKPLLEVIAERALRDEVSGDTEIGVVPDANAPITPMGGSSECDADDRTKGAGDDEVTPPAPRQVRQRELQKEGESSVQQNAFSGQRYPARGFDDSPISQVDKSNSIDNSIPADVHDAEECTVAEILWSMSAPTTLAKDHRQKLDLENKQSCGLMDQHPSTSPFKSNGDHCEFTTELSPSEVSWEGLKKSPLPSRKRKQIIDLDSPKSKQTTMRRVSKRWTLLEEGTFREAVQKHGVGNWKFILNCYSDVFEGRTQVDLKDKWRNMIR